MKLIVNQAYENMGLASTQLLGPILDGLMRNTPEAQRFIELAEREGVARRRRRARRRLRRLQPGPARPSSPNPANVIEPSRGCERQAPADRLTAP